MSTPNLGLVPVPQGVLQPGVPVNDSFQTLDTLVQLAVEATTPTPPTTTSDDFGKRWIVGPGATGVWTGRDDQIALCSAATLWRYYAPEEGWQAYDKDQAAPLVYEGGSSGWALLSVPTVAAAEDVSYDNEESGLTADNAQAAIDELAADIAAISAGAPPVVTEATTALTADATNAGNYTRFTNDSLVTYTFDDAEIYAVGAEYHGRAVGAAGVIVDEAGGMIVNPPAGGTLEIPEGGTFTVKIVASDEADLFGVTVPA